MVVVLLPILGLGLVSALLHYAEHMMMKHGETWHDGSNRILDTPDRYQLALYSKGSADPTSGSGLLFIHGSPGDASNFHQQFETLFPNFLHLAYDRPGFGKSRAAQSPDNLSWHTQAAFDAIQTHPNTKWIAIGHSYGGPVAMNLAIDHPNEIIGVVQIGGAMDPSLEKIHVLQKIARWSTVSWIIPKSFRHSNVELINLKADLLELQNKLGRLQRPVVMLHGTDDSLVPVSNCEYMSNQLASRQLSDLLILDVRDGWNHFIPWQNPAAVHEAIRLLLGHPSLHFIGDEM